MLDALTSATGPAGIAPGATRPGWLPAEGATPDAARPRHRHLALAAPWDLALTLGPLRHGRGDRSVQLAGRTLWRATGTPLGPATQAVVADPGGGAVRSWAWGPGAEWVLDGLPDLVGADEGAAAFAAMLARPPVGLRPPGWEVVASLARRMPGLRIPRTRSVVEAALPTVLEQKVTSIEATRSWHDLVGLLGSPAPGPGATRGLLVPPAAGTVAATPSWSLHRLGVERKRADTLRRVGTHARRLEEAVDLAPDAARARICAVPGLGPWSAAEIALVALGDPDAVSVGDFHLPNQVAWALAGQARGDDAMMLELLEPWRGQRGRVLRILTAGGVRAPKFGPRQPLRSFRGF